MFSQFSILSTIDNVPREHLFENKARFSQFFVFIPATSVKADIISENIHWEISANVFFPDSVVLIYVTIFFCSGKSENDLSLSVRDFSSHGAWTFTLQSLRLPFNLCTSSEEIYFRDVFSLFLPANCFFVVRRLLTRKTFHPSNGEILAGRVRRIFATGFD